MPRDTDITYYEVDNSHFSEMKEIAMQEKIARNGETALLHDPRPTTPSRVSYEAYVDGRKIGNFASKADALAAIREEP